MVGRRKNKREVEEEREVRVKKENKEETEMRLGRWQEPSLKSP